MFCTCVSNFVITVSSYLSCLSCCFQHDVLAVIHYHWNYGLRVFLQVLAYMLDRNAALLPAYIAHDEVCGNDIKIVCVSFLKLFMINFDHIWFME